MLNFLAVSLLLAAPEAPPARPAAGDKAPAFAAPSTAGGEASLDGFKGKTVVLAFFPKAFTAG